MPTVSHVNRISVSGCRKVCNFSESALPNKSISCNFLRSCNKIGSVVIYTPAALRCFVLCCCVVELCCSMNLMALGDSHAGSIDCV